MAKQSSEPPPAAAAAAPGSSSSTPTAAAADETSAGIVRRGPKTKREIGLERRISEMEDERAQTLAETKELRKTVDAARSTPSKRFPGKSLWEELNVFMGWGD